MRLLAQMNRLLEPIRNRIRIMINKAVLNLVDDSTGIQLIQADIVEDSTKDKIPRIQQYGFTSVPKKDAQVILACLNGNRSNSIALAVDDSRYRVKNLSDGNVAIYDCNGNMVKLTDDGMELAIYSGKDLVINCKNCSINLESGGQFSVAGTKLTVDA